MLFAGQKDQKGIVVCCFFWKEVDVVFCLIFLGLREAFYVVIFPFLVYGKEPKNSALGYDFLFEMPT